MPLLGPRGGRCSSRTRACSGATAYAFEAGAGRRRRRRDDVADRAICSRARTPRSTIRSRPPARPRCCSSTSRDGWSTTRRGTRGREVSHLLRGEVDVDRGRGAARSPRPRHLRLLDNGVVRSKSDALDVDDPHAYHLVPREVGQGRAPSPRTCRSAATRRRVRRRRRLARGPQRRGGRRHLLARRQRGGQGPARSRIGAAANVRVARRPPTALASTRPSSPSSPSAARGVVALGRIIRHNCNDVTRPD